MDSIYVLERESNGDLVVLDFNTNRVHYGLTPESPWLQESDERMEILLRAFTGKTVGYTCIGTLEYCDETRSCAHAFAPNGEDLEANSKLFGIELEWNNLPRNERV